MEHICCKIESIGQDGVKLRVIGLDDDPKPRGCPGLGGWKNDFKGWWTKVKGMKACDDFRAFGVGNFVDITLDGDKIVSLSA